MTPTWQNWGKLQVKLEFSIQNWGKLQVKLGFCHVGLCQTFSFYPVVHLQIM